MLLFITTSYLYITLQIIISIHLMLLFIGFALYESGNTMVFQYISCYCLSLYQHSWMCLHQDFNTSHVTVYQGYHKAGKEVWDISIHLMLLFITPGQASAIRLIYISIHLMLLFINNETAQVAQEILFQYISCYCLSDRSESATVSSTDISIHLMLLFITVAGKIIEPKIWFQYISCYCLSVSKSCSISSVLISIHLMLLFIIHRRLIPQILCSISIHLMLLFINKSECIICRNKRFQYISCYCLSPSEHPIFLPVFISIHLMLLFIGELVLLCSC